MKNVNVLSVLVCRNVIEVEGIEKVNKSINEYLKSLDGDSLEYYLNWSDGGERKLKDLDESLKVVVLEGEEDWKVIGEEGDEFDEVCRMLLGMIYNIGDLNKVIEFIESKGVVKIIDNM